MDTRQHIELGARRSEAESCINPADFDLAIRIHHGIIADYRGNDNACEQAYADMGHIHMLFRQMDLAENSYLLALSYSLQNLECHYWLGFIRLFRDYPDDAIAELEYCVKHAPGRFDYHCVLGLFYSGIVATGVRQTGA